MDTIRYDGKVAIVTGAGGGLGRTHSLLLASRGAKVVVNDLGGSAFGEGKDTTPAQKVVNEIKAAGGEAVANYDSVTNGEKIVQAALDSFGRVDIVINNAGILRDKSFHKMTDEDWNLIFDVHVQGSYKVTKAAWPYMRDQSYGRIVLTSSAAGIYGNFGQANYSAAKMALIGFGQTLALEGKNRNVLVNIIAPIAGSRMTATVLSEDLINMLKPEYVSPLVAYLCSDQCTETGSLYEVGAGCIHRLQWLRSVGVMLPLKEGIKIEDVAKNFEKINDMTNAKVFRTIGESSMSIMGNLASAQ